MGLWRVLWPLIGRDKGAYNMSYSQSDLDKINTALNCLEAVRSRILEDLKGSKTRAKAPEISKPLNEMGELNREITVKQCLGVYGQPTDDEHVKAVVKIVNTYNASMEQLNGCLGKIQEYSRDHEINDLKRYTYGSLHKEFKGR